MKSVCVFTGTRAEYGLLRGLISGLSAEGGYDVTALVSGTHLSAEYGATCREIERDGFCRLEKCETLLSSDSPVGVCKSMGLGLIGYAEILERLKPDLAIGLGDRFELLSFASASLILSIPLLHLHGGELSLGAIDESIRHSISKMARFHAVSADEYRDRLIQMGEGPATVRTVGALGIDNVLTAEEAERIELERDIPVLRGRDGAILVTMHPETSLPGTARRNFDELSSALEAFPGHAIIVTGANADAEGRLVNDAMAEWCASAPNRHFEMSLGMRRYLGVLKIAGAVVGNSSSGILEAPAVGVPTVDIGERQAGRVRPSTVIHCPFEREAIKRSILSALATPRAGDPLAGNPYWHGGAVKGIVDFIGSLELRDLGPKEFHSCKVQS